MFKKLMSFLVLIAISSTTFSESCPNCWEPILNFDLEGLGFENTMIFISGQGYALSESNRILRRMKSKNFFCKNGSVTSKDLIEILNQRLSGTVSSEDITANIFDGLYEKFPCF